MQRTQQRSSTGSVRATSSRHSLRVLSGPPSPTGRQHTAHSALVASQLSVSTVTSATRRQLRRMHHPLHSLLHSSAAHSLRAMQRGLRSVRRELNRGLRAGVAPRSPRGATPSTLEAHQLMCDDVEPQDHQPDRATLHHPWSTRHSNLSAVISAAGAVCIQICSGWRLPGGTFARNRSTDASVLDSAIGLHAASDAGNPACHPPGMPPARPPSSTLVHLPRSLCGCWGRGVSTAAQEHSWNQQLFAMIATQLERDSVRPESKVTPKLPQ